MEVIGEMPLFDIMRLLKGATSRHCNKLLALTGKHFWQYESYDHVVRRGSLERIIRYVIMNPVKAGLVANWQEWMGTYLSSQYDVAKIISPN
jgi:REP element-mobilizing transposase RayT